MEAFLWFLAIPLLGIVSPIWLSFEKDIKPINKALLFLLLPIAEILLSIWAIIESLSNDTNLINAWQLPFICSIAILGFSFTLIVVFVDDISNRLKLSIKLIALSILSFITVWGIILFSKG